MKKNILLFASILMLASCSNEEVFTEETVQVIEESVQVKASFSRTAGTKVNVCHKNANDIVIGESALQTHIDHGDAVDRDGDGFYDKENPCSDIDCDDSTYSLENTCGTPANIGDLRDGGVVFWVNPDNNARGMVVSLVELGNAEWGCYLTEIEQETYDDTKEFGDGYNLTQSILENCSQQGIAAEVAVNFRGGNYTDWFLPSYTELSEILKVDLVINPILVANGGHRVVYDPNYWSSNQFDESQALNSFSLTINPLLPKAEKFVALRVRAVRSF